MKIKMETQLSIVLQWWIVEHARNSLRNQPRTDTTTD